MDLTGRELSDYRVLRKIGAGGMAEVYLAEQRSLGRQVALKVLHPSLAQDTAYVQRFQQEARAAASLTHANIVQIYEVGHADGVHFIAQEYVPGKNLGELLLRQTSLEPRLVLDIMRQVASALSRAAEAGIVHRDIKPENILLSHSGEVKVADFGLARVESADQRALTQVGVAMGTPLYMSPEQIEGRPLDARSDIYSLGITCYHLLAGAPPHRGDTALAIAVQHLNATPRALENIRDDIPSGLARVVHKMIAKKPPQRYASPAELLADLRKLAGEAAAEGWGEGPDHWTLAEWISSATSPSQSVDELGELMRENTRLRSQRFRFAPVAALLAAALAVGAVAGLAARPRPYLATSRPANPHVQKRDTAWAQLFQANMAPSEAAWNAVEEFFPDEDPYVYDLARQGLVRYHLLVSEERDYAKALPVLNQLLLSSDADPQDSSLRAFAFAGLCIANQRLGRLEEARLAAAQLTGAMKDQLRRNEGRLYELLEASLRALAEQAKVAALL